MTRTIFLFLLPIAVSAGPSGDKVAYGSATIDQSTPKTTIINQKSQNVILDWDRFSLTHDETATFIQPNRDAIVVNRVNGENLSEIYGKIEGNGQVFLVNPNGVLIGESGVIQCGAFLASGIPIEENSFFRHGPLSFKEGSGTVVNLGSIQGTGGKVILIGEDVQNLGKATADQGVYIQIEGSSVFVQAQRSAVGKVNNPYALAIYCEGKKEASSFRKTDGQIFLEPTPEFTLVDVPKTSIPDAGAYIEDVLYASQQLSSLIPERLWYQRFSILVNQLRFMTAIQSAPHYRFLANSQPVSGISSSHYYFQQNTISGDSIRLSDEYEEFLHSPYWKTPDELEQLDKLQRKALR